MELVHVVLAELVVEELISRINQRVLGIDAGEHQRPWVCRREEDRVDREQRMNGPHYLGLEGGATKA